MRGEKALIDSGSKGNLSVIIRRQGAIPQVPSSSCAMRGISQEQLRTLDLTREGTCTTCFAADFSSFCNQRRISLC